MPKHRESESVRFAMNRGKRKISERLCTHKNYGMIFQALLAAVTLELTLKYTIRDPNKKQINERLKSFFDC